MNVLVVRKGTLYGPKYVRLLRDQVAKFHPGVSFVCLTDQSDMPDVPVSRLRHQWPGWWSKLELFAPWNAHYRPCLYIDLDSYVLRDLTPLLEDSGELFTMCRDFYDRANANSSVMIIPRDASGLWADWTQGTDRHMAENARGGDQVYLERFVQRRFPREVGIRSYKADKLQFSPGDARGS